MWDLVPQPGTKLGPPPLGVRSLSHETTRAVLLLFFLSTRRAEAEKDSERLAGGEESRY